MSPKKFGLIILLLCMGLIAGGVWFVGRFDQNVVVATSEKAKVEVKETNFSWGNIPINGGVVTKEFTLTNTGTEGLKLYNVATSCMCTTAQLISPATQSPIFRMHEQSNYVLTVIPQESITLKVVFDPAYHGPNGVGKIDRKIKIETNDATRPWLEFSLDGVVIK